MLLASTVSVFPVLSFSQVLDSSAVLGRRIGSEIDTHERNFFGLFPGTENFQTANMRQGKGGTEITITHKVGSERKDTIVYLDADDSALLKSMIIDYEQVIQESGVFALDVLQKRYARLVQRGIVFFPSVKMQYPQEVKVRMLNEQEMQAVLLFANEKYLVLASPGLEERELWSDTNLFVIPYQNIRCVTHSVGSQYKTGASIGAAIGFVAYSVMISIFGGTSHNFSNDPPDPALFLLAGVSGGLAGGLVGLVIGSTIPRTEEWLINGDQINFVKHLAELKQVSIYFEDPSPEVMRKLSIIGDE